MHDWAEIWESADNTAKIAETDILSTRPRTFVAHGGSQVCSLNSTRNSELLGSFNRAVESFGTLLPEGVVKVRRGVVARYMVGINSMPDVYRAFLHFAKVLEER